jgi:hypothetical protein
MKLSVIDLAAERARRRSGNESPATVSDYCVVARDNLRKVRLVSQPLNDFDRAQMFAEMLSYSCTTGFAEVEICQVTGTGLVPISFRRHT